MSGNSTPPPGTCPAPGDPVRVRLVKDGRTKISYPAVLHRDDGVLITVLAPWAGRGTRDFGFVRFEPGDRFVEHYWRDRWYAVKAVHTPAGTLKGWYCDITRPAVRTGGVIEVVDLELDLWVAADGTAVLRLDEDEFAASGLATADPGAARAAVAALDELERLACSSGGAGFAAALGLEGDVPTLTS